MQKSFNVKFYSAFDLNGKEIHISDALSGSNGYYCRGCNARMIAHKGDINEHFFRHHPEDMHLHKTCKYADETYRHKLAKEILQRTKEVLVPHIYIEIPTQYGGGKQRIRYKRIISAYSVLNERYIYEDEFGEIKYSKEFDEKDTTRNLLIKPDILFLDKDGKIILIIELHATNKVDKKKLWKLKHLGIDAIEIKIPTHHDDVEIEKNFYITKYTHWLYNYEQETTEFIPTSKGNRTGYGEIEDDEGEFFPFRETYECRTFHIREIIRRIRKSMGRSDFREAESDLKNEISRVEENTKRARERLQARSRRAEDEAREQDSNFFAKKLGESERTIRETKETATRLKEELRGLEENKFIAEQDLAGESERAREAAAIRISQDFKARISNEEQSIDELVKKETDVSLIEKNLERRYNRKKDQIEKLHYSLPIRIQNQIRLLENDKTRINSEIGKLTGEFNSVTTEERRIKNALATTTEYADRESEAKERERRIVEIEEGKISGIKERRGMVRKRREKLSAVQDKTLTRGINKPK